MAKVKKGIFILPSLLTLTSIFFSFYSLVESIEGHFALAAALILVAAFFDGIDGKVARLTNTTTRFGLELDSLADVFLRGCARHLGSSNGPCCHNGQIGLGERVRVRGLRGLRLARFNVQSGTIDPKRFNGIPIPAAAAMMSTTVLFFHKMELNPGDSSCRCSFSR